MMVYLVSSRDDGGCGVADAGIGDGYVSVYKFANGLVYLHLGELMVINDGDGHFLFGFANTTFDVINIRMVLSSQYILLCKFVVVAVKLLYLRKHIQM